MRGYRDIKILNSCYLWQVIRAKILYRRCLCQEIGINILGLFVPGDWDKGTVLVLLVSGEGGKDAVLVLLVSGDGDKDTVPVLLVSGVRDKYTDATCVSR